MFSAANRLRSIAAVILLTIVSVVLFACREDENEGPVISLVRGAGYVSGDTLLKPGAAFNFAIYAENLQADITNLYVTRIFNGGEEVLIDTGIHNATFSYSRTMNKGIHESEEWIFRVTDQEGKRASVSFVLGNDPSAVYDSVRFWPSVIFGAQSNGVSGSFMAPASGNIYFLDQAFLVQDSIHLCYYYDPAGDYNTIASPGANIDSLIYPGVSGLWNWTIRNESRFLKTGISSDQFQAVVHDSLLIASYDVINAKRKAKNLAAGDIYSFRMSNGKFGLFRVTEVNGAETGTIEIALKIQQ